MPGEEKQPAQSLRVWLAETTVYPTGSWQANVDAQTQERMGSAVSLARRGALSLRISCQALLSFPCCFPVWPSGLHLGVHTNFYLLPDSPFCSPALDHVHIPPTSNTITLAPTYNPGMTAMAEGPSAQSGPWGDQAWMLHVCNRPCSHQSEVPCLSSVPGPCWSHHCTSVFLTVVKSDPFIKILYFLLFILWTPGALVFSTSHVGSWHLWLQAYA